MSFCILGYIISTRIVIGHPIPTRGLEILFGCVVRGREETNKLEGDHRSKKLSSMTLGGSGGSGIVGEASLPLPSFSITFLLT
ncbi:hypothetical protein B296_00043667 [Ensete ventricosum]|uniref:Uncharacterized protein n=1 Tax=Ensete ventricosum TaxID=4639 RepID=A0A426XYE0_ENSVE|nr:hypothetical protein B296_00043667 [Ensete ventricosum]